MKSCTWLLSHHQKQGEHRQDSALPRLILLYTEQEQHSSTPGWEVPEELGSPTSPPGQPHPQNWGSFGAWCCAGDGEVFQEVFQSQHSPPPQASLQLSLKTEKFVLVFLLLLSSYEMSPTTENLNKFRLLKQHLLQLLSNLHHNFKPLIY